MFLHKCTVSRAIVRAVLFAFVLLAQACSYYTLKEDASVVNERFRANPPKSIAVLPVRNLTDKTGIDETVRRGLYRGISPLNYEDVELRVVDEAVAQRSLAVNVAPKDLKPSDFATTPPADALLYCDIFRVSKFWLIFYSHMRIGVDLRMIDARSQEPLYSSRAVLHKRHIDLPTSIQGLLGTSVMTLWYLRDSEIGPTTDELGRRIAETFPNPPRLAEGGDVGITAVFVTPQHPVLRAGDELSVAVWGTPRAIATFDIGNTIKDVPLNENSPGRYAGSYTVVPGDEASGVVQGRLRNGAGETVTMSNVEGDFRIEAVPPARPEIRAVDFAGGGVKLTLGLPHAESEMRFEIYRASGDETRHEYCARVDEMQWTDRRVESGAVYSYIVKAVNSDGAVSQVSVPRRVEVPPRGPVVLTGPITEKMVLQPYSSPYIVKGNVVAEATSEIDVRPGTEIRISSGSRLVLRGRAAFNGTPDAPIRIRGTNDSVLVVWEPDGTTETLRMEHVDFRQGSTALLARRGNVQLERCRFDNAHTGLFLEAETSVHLVGCMFRNLEQGIMGEPRRLEASLNTFHRLPHSINVNTPEVALKQNDFSGSGVAVQQRGPWVVRVDGNWFEGRRDHLNLLRRLQGPCVFESLNEEPSARGRTYRPFPGVYEETIENANRAWDERRYDWALHDYLNSWWRQKDREVGLRLVRILGRGGLVGNRYSVHPDMKSLDRRAYRTESALHIARTLVALHPMDLEVLTEYVRYLDKTGDTAAARLWQIQVIALENSATEAAREDSEPASSLANEGENP